MRVAQDYSEEQIKELFQKASDNVDPSPDTLVHIHSKVHSDASGKNGGIIMFKKNYVKVAAIALVCILLSGGAVYASRGLMWYGSGTPGEYTSYSELNKAFDKAGLDASVPEALAYGFKFKEASVEEFGQIDDAYNKVSSYQGVDVYYEDEKGQQISINIEPVVADDTDEEPIAEKELAGGIIASFDSHEMLTVPSRDYVSEEDAKRELTDPKFWISEGSDKPERSIYNNVRFKLGNISYNILGFDLDLTQDEMFEIAQMVADWNQ